MPETLLKTDSQNLRLKAYSAKDSTTDFSIAISIAIFQANSFTLAYLIYSHS